jgi:Zn-dependent metalloprotease
MYRSLKFLVITSVLAAASTAAAQTNAFDLPSARTVHGGAGALTPPSDAGARAVLAQFLRGSGRDDATIASLAEANRSAGRQGLTHVQFEQRAAGLPVYGTYVKAAFGANGALISVTENLVAVPADIRRASIAAPEAIAAAVRNLYPALRTVPPGFFRNNGPSAERVAIPHPDGSMSVGFLVETWTERSNQLHETLVDGNGDLLYVESRTQSTTDEYNVFRVNPDITPQAVTAGPGAGNAESPQGWLFAGAQNSTDIAGNNVRAYLDVASDNVPDNPGTPVADGHFHTAADLGSSPSTSQNRNVAVQNLFYLNNLIHDELYRHGFTESTLNFQENNFGNGGRGSDSVNAEAQDGGGTNNANFSTPRDGRNPRMQMYLWTGDGPTHSVLAGGEILDAAPAAFGGTLDTTGVSASIVLVTDGGGASSTDACEAITNNVSGAIALIDRGTCDFVVKVKNAQNAGAVGAVVANNDAVNPDTLIFMGGTDATITIPALGISFNSGTTLKAMVPVAGTMKLNDVQPLQRDGDIDADIVFHEYCHGLTWRMIGSMSGPIAGALGEGMSDVCAIMLTAYDENNQLRPGADVVAEYSFSNPGGLRRQPYDGYNLFTYGELSGASVHNDGELYGAIGWRLLELFGGTRRDELFGYMVDGMNFTPSAPAFEDMRDGILQSIANNSPTAAADSCLVWQAFAEYGVGEGATSDVRRIRFTITESFAVPASCQP